MKNILNAIKTTIIVGVITIFTIIPVMADSNDLSIVNHYTNDKGDCITQFVNGTQYINSDVNIQSISYIDNSIIIEKDSQLYKFYVDEPREYFLTETINVTFNNKMEIIDCIVDIQPVIYNTQINSIEGNLATLSANWNQYSFENAEGLDGWIVGDKCKAVIQDGILLEVRPIPLCER